MYVIKPSLSFSTKSSRFKEWSRSWRKQQIGSGSQSPELWGFFPEAPYDKVNGRGEKRREGLFFLGNWRRITIRYVRRKAEHLRKPLAALATLARLAWIKRGNHKSGDLIISALKNCKAKRV